MDKTEKSVTETTKRNWHSIVGPNGMCECGVKADGTVVNCSDLMASDVVAKLAAIVGWVEEIGSVMAEWKSGTVTPWSSLEKIEELCEDPTYLAVMDEASIADLLARLPSIPNPVALGGSDQ